ncbi:hypothetical protein F5Y18DRAFT_440682 [Xylariaceae sp. FL1019]|nr:hypothetical protein F5Y18DRAFT_440682 [Xylariaceae sp. FL1019]
MYTIPILFFPVVVRALTTCCSFPSLLPDETSVSGSDAYNESVSSYIFVNRRQAPACIVSPTTATQVAQVLRALEFCSNYSIAVRSGGHSPNRGFSNTDNGITLDLRKLQEVKMHRTKSGILSVGTGALWADVYAYLDPMNLTVVGSRVVSVGAGGLAQLAAFAKFKTSQYNPHVEIEQTYVYFGSQKTYSSANNLFYTRNVINAKALRLFSDIQPQAADFADEIETFRPIDQFATYSTMSFSIYAANLTEIHILWKAAKLLWPN